ncbi:MAG: homoserine dehydrogenase [Ahrensia sp.]|nr:homoserine dehydrogenase [Ahrensia sp.]
MATNVAPTGLTRDLLRARDEGRPVRIGLIGCGEMGTDIVTQTALMPGVDVAAVCDSRFTRAEAAAKLAYGEGGHTRRAHSNDELTCAIEAGKIGIVDDAHKVLENGLVDVVVEATGLPGVGGELGLAAIERGKHVVMMNVEADVTVGSYLKRQADRLGVVYSLGAGDEPSSCMELVEFVSAMGHRIVCAGKGKNNPLNIDATPDQYEEEASRRNMNPRMLVEFVDGSKTMVEMAAIANATGLVPDKDGMHGPSATEDELAKVLIPQADGGVLSAPGRVDFSVGKGVAPGVFVIAEMANPRIQERMEDLKLGEGPYFTFIRPFHLTSLEVPLSCARAVLYGKADMVPLDRRVAEVCALAKKDLAPGETLDKIGQYCYRSWIMEAQRAHDSSAIPVGLLENAKVTQPIKKGDLITYGNCKPDAQSKIVQLRALQDAMA